jgi:hypothetical protein
LSRIPDREEVATIEHDERAMRMYNVREDALVGAA